MGNLSSEMLRDVIIRAHDMATARMIQDDTEMKKRIGRLLEKAIESDDIMNGFLGRGGPCSDRDFIRGSGSLSE